jgi:hypothetical protein
MQRQSSVSYWVGMRALEHVVPSPPGHCAEMILEYLEYFCHQQEDRTIIKNGK